MLILLAIINDGFKAFKVVTCFSFIIFVYVRRKMIKDIASIEIVDLRLRSIKIKWSMSHGQYHMVNMIWTRFVWCRSWIRVSYENVLLLIIETKFDFITDPTDVICVKPIMNPKKSTSWIDEMNLDYLVEKDHKRIWKLSPNYGNKFTAGSVYYFLVNTEFDVDTEDINDCKVLGSLDCIWYGPYRMAVWVHRLWFRSDTFYGTDDPCPGMDRI